MPFSSLHIPALFVGTTTTFGGFYGLFNPSWAMKEFGLPARLYNSPDAQSVFHLRSVQTTVIGLLIYTFYFTGRYAEVDTVMSIVGAWAGIVDSWVCYKQGMQGKAIFRLVASWALSAYGIAGITAKGATV